MCEGPEAGMGVSYTRNQNENNRIGACGLCVCVGIAEKAGEIRHWGGIIMKRSQGKKFRFLFQ